MRRRFTRRNCVLGHIIAVLVLWSAACGSHSPPPIPSASANTPPRPHTSAPISPQAPTSPPNPMDAPAPPASRTDGAAHVLRIIDGDTIEVEINGAPYRIRYIGVDTPEQGMPFYQAAAQANAALVADRNVWLEKDVSETDRYGRLLRYVYVGDRMVNEALVRQGYAQVATYPPDVRYQDRFLAVQQEARTSGLGLWAPAASPPTEPPPGQPLVTVGPSQSSNCDPSYPDVCIPPPPPDLDCGQIPFRRFAVVGADPHRFDGDHNGIGCEK